MNDDIYAGQGGSYLLDPATGLRTLVQRTEDAAPALEAAVQPVAAPLDYPALDDTPPAS